MTKTVAQNLNTLANDINGYTGITFCEKSAGDGLVYAITTSYKKYCVLDFRCPLIEGVKGLKTIETIILNRAEKTSKAILIIFDEFNGATTEMKENIKTLISSLNESGFFHFVVIETK